MAEKDRKIRSGQIITSFGIGQIVPFPDNENLMLGSLELWDSILTQRIRENPNKINLEDFQIKDAKRLQKLLGVSHFKIPFPFDSKLVRLPGIRFPGWHYCSRCGTMKHLNVNFAANELECVSNVNIRGRTCAQLSSNESFKKKLIPVRFIAVCAEGHIQDVPFDEWVHGTTTGHRLQWNSGYGSGDLSSISIKCLTCSTTQSTVSRSLAGLTSVSTDDNNNRNITQSALSRIGLAEGQNEQDNPNAQRCKGLRPWLGHDNPENCNLNLRVLISGGSNVHFSKTKSSIYVPDIALKISDYVKAYLTPALTTKIKIYIRMDADESIKEELIYADIDSHFANSEFEKSILKEEILKQVTDGDSEESENFTDVDVRNEEYQYFLSENDNLDGDLVLETKDFSNYFQENGFLENHFDNIVLIKRLKETRAFYGFSRINPYDGKSILESKNMLVSSGQRVDWLPAIQVYGEGIFLNFSKHKLNEWIQTQDTTRIQNAYHNAQTRRNASYGNADYPMKDINPIFILLHTFAHLLIKRLCFNCGYGSSALREKIYFSSNEETLMHGILIYTSSGDSEGSLGGLVRQGSESFLYQNIMDALSEAGWCSADPVCSDLGLRGQGPDNINGAACHNCCILPETSCEEFNSLLDRNLVVGSIVNNSEGYFEV